MQMPTLHTRRLLIRPFTLDDLDDIHPILSASFPAEPAVTRDERRRWLQWAALNTEQLAQLRQPPYGDRAIVLKPAGALIGACGFVPCLMPFAQLPALRGAALTSTGERPFAPSLTSTEFGLFYAISSAHRRQGYASEAARAMLAYAFGELGLRRVVATTDYDNLASVGVMRKLGMSIERNPYPDPLWLQVVGVRNRE